MLTKEQKKEIVKDLAEDLKGAKSAVFSDYQNLKAGDIQKLRADLREEGVGHKVVKITLLKRALARAGIDISEFNYQVPLAVTYSPDDEVMPAKILADFAKSNKDLEILAGILDGEMIDVEQVKSLASLPSKQDLRAMVASAVAGPLRGLVGVLSANLRQVVYVFKAIEESKS